MSQNGGGGISSQLGGGEQLTILASGVGAFIELEFPIPDVKPRQLVLHATRAPDFGTLKFSIDGKRREVTFDGYAANVQPAEPKLGASSSPLFASKHRHTTLGLRDQDLAAMLARRYRSRKRKVLQTRTMESGTMKLLSKCLLLKAVLLWSLSMVVRGDEAVRRTEDVVYGRKHGMALTLDVFQPAQPNGCGLLFLVNGGWLSSKATPLMVTIRPDDYHVYLNRGYTVFAVVTSSQPKFTIPELMDDVQRAVRFVRSNAAKYGVRPDRLGVLGSSSGGQLVLSIATRGGPGKPDSPDPIERESSGVQAVACFFPPKDFLNYGGPGISGVGQGPLAPLQVAFGPQALTAEGRAILGREVSPIYFVTSQLPPTLIIHGDADQVVPLQQSESFVARAKEVNARHAELIVRPGKGHGWGDFWRSTEDVTAFADWFDRQLKSHGETR